MNNLRSGLCFVMCLWTVLATSAQPNEAPAADWTATQWLAHAEDAARQIEDPEQRLWRVSYIAQGYAMLDDPEANQKAAQLSEDATELLKQIADPETRGYAAGAIVYALARSGKQDDAEAMIRTIPTLATRIAARMMLAHAAFERDDEAVLRAQLREADLDIPRLDDDWERDNANAAVVPYLVALGEMDAAKERVAKVDDVSNTLWNRAWAVGFLVEAGQPEEAKAWARAVRFDWLKLDVDERLRAAVSVLEGLAKAGLPGEAEALLEACEPGGERVWCEFTLAASYHRAGEDGLAAGLFERALQQTVNFKPGDEDYYGTADLWAAAGETASEIGKLDAVTGGLDGLDADSRAAFATEVAMNMAYQRWLTARNPQP